MYRKHSIIAVVVLLFTVAFNFNGQAQLVTTVAGMAGQAGYQNGTGASARFDSPHGIACDNAGNIYIADRYNHRIRKMDMYGNVTLLAGSGMIGASDGAGAAATFNEPWAVACDTAGNIYVADTKNYKIRKITPSGVVSTIAGQGTFGTTNGPAAVAKFGFPSGICVTPDGSIIYVADHNTHVIRAISNGIVSNLAGISYVAGSDDGSSAVATFNHPYGIELDNNGNVIVADEWNSMIRKVTPSGNVVGSPGTELEFAL